jgi:hypothetical protein
MLKPLYFSLSLALALGFCSVSKAGGLFHDHLASPPGPAPSAQYVSPSPQVECGPSCVGECGAKKCALFSHLKGMGDKLNCGIHDKINGMSCGFNNLCQKLKPKPPVYTYEWVLKKKRVWHHKGLCGEPTCETCGVYPSGQGAPSPQGPMAAPQTFGTYGSGQVSNGMMGTGQIAAAPAPMVVGDEAPPAPEVAPAAPAPSIPPAPRASTGGLLFSSPAGN